MTLDAAAEAAGAQTMSAEVWEVALLDGSVAALVRTTAEARHVVADGRQKRVYTLAEIGNLIHGFPEIVCAKDTFPGAEVTAVRHRHDPLEEFDDEISF
jgi:hypothetical protein